MLEGTAVCDKNEKGILRAIDSWAIPGQSFDDGAAGRYQGGENAGIAGDISLGNEQRTANRRESLEKTIAKILHRYCNFGWANYYIPGEKFPSLIEELVEIASPAGQAGFEEIVHFLLRTQRMTSAQERAAKLLEEFGVYRKA